MGETTAKVLIVDDEDNVQRALRRELHGEPYEVFCASSGEEGLIVAAEHRPEVIISDYRMPGLTGVEFLSSAREMLPDTLGILLTGQASMDAVIAAINQARAYRFLTKPWDKMQLLQTIRDAVSHYRLVDENRRLHAEVQTQNETLQMINTTLEQKVKERTAELQEKNERLTRMDRMKSDFLAIAGHELRTPLSVMAGYAQMLQDTGDQLDDLQKKTMYDQIAGGAERLSTITDQILDMAREERIVTLLRRQDCHVGGLIDRVVDGCRTFLEARGQSIALDVPGDLPVITADPNGVTDVLTNLLLNAIRFTQDGGSIVVGAGAGAGADEVLTYVQDNGLGIPKDEQDRIFEPFYEVGSALHHSSGRIEFQSKSMGLGLAIAKSIVARHGGRIAVDSEPDAGSTFTVYWPCAGSLEGVAAGVVREHPE